jgi:hypothetical protein
MGCLVWNIFRKVALSAEMGKEPCPPSDQAFSLLPSYGKVANGSYELSTLTPDAVMGRAQKNLQA